MSPDDNGRPEAVPEAAEAFASAAPIVPALHICGLLRLDVRNLDDPTKLHRAVAPIEHAPDGANVELVLARNQHWSGAAVETLRAHADRLTITVVAADPGTVSAWVGVLREGVPEW